MNSTNDSSESDRMTESDGSSRYEEIASLAYKQYLQEGCPEGRALEHWLKAEAQLKRRLPGTPHDETSSSTPSTPPASTLLSATPATAPIQKEGSFFSEEQAAKTIKRGRKPRHDSH